jgi:hypothetical protein
MLFASIPESTPHTHSPGDCPGGCDDIKQVEKELAEGAIRMTNIEESLDSLAGKFDDHIRVSNETNTLVTEVLDILHAGRGFFKIVGYIATGIKWTAAFVAPLVALYYTLKSGGKL